MDLIKFNAKDKILSIMKEKNTDVLKINRKYLPEFIAFSLLDFESSNDGLPILDSRFKLYLSTSGIKVEYKALLVIFYRVFDKSMSKIHKEITEGLSDILEKIPEEFRIGPIPTLTSRPRIIQLKSQLKKIKTHLMKYDYFNPDLFRLSMDIGKLEAGLLNDDVLVLIEYKWKKYIEKLKE